MSRNLFLAGLAAICISVGVGVAAVNRVPAHPQAPDFDSNPTSTSSSIQVHVAGWVRSAGVVSLPEGSIVADAIEASGGLLPGADTESLNLASELVDGDQVVVEGPGGDGGEAQGETRVVVNRASAGELETLPGVGPVLAQRIVDYRDENGPFGEVEDLLDVPGIGESKLSSLRDLVRIP